MCNSLPQFVLTLNPVSLSRLGVINLQTRANMQGIISIMYNSKLKAMSDKYRTVLCRAPAGFTNTAFTYTQFW